MYALTKSGITILTKEKSGTCFLIVWHDTKTAVNTVRTFKRYGIQYGASILNAMYVREVLKDIKNRTINFET